MNAFDVSIVTFLNAFARRSWAFDMFVSTVLQSPFVKAGILSALLWWVWFQPSDRQDERREFILSGIVASFLVIVACRILAVTLPFRVRPLHNPSLHFRIPYGLEQDTLINWSSFPSDHAALFSALAVTIFFVSRRAGLLAALHVFLVVCLTRVYLGLHYPTDILTGVALGIAFASLTKITLLRKSVAKPGMRWAHAHPPSFYASFFLVTLLISMLFDPVRQLFHFLFVTLRASGKA